jgi:hypothetical protein
MSMNAARLVEIDPQGDIDLAIQDYIFIVSSWKMSTISRKFEEVFSNRDNLPRKSIELVDEDPAAFRVICLLAHTSFVPHDDISVDTLITLADAIQRYGIAPRSKISQMVYYKLRVCALLPGTTEPCLIRILRIAEALDSAVHGELLKDMFFRRPLDLEALPTDPQLHRLRARGLECRVQVAWLLLQPAVENMYNVALGVLRENASLQYIYLQLDPEDTNLSEHLHQYLLRARAEIERTKEEFYTYVDGLVRRECAIGVETFRSGYGVKQPDFQRTCEVKSSSHSDTEFEEDIENIAEYSEPVDEQYDSYVQSDDNESNKSRRRSI